MIMITYPVLLGIGVPLLGLAVVARWFFYKEPVYIFSSLLPLRDKKNQGELQSFLLYFLRTLGLLFLLISLARPRLPDVRTRVPVDGVDIMLVLDVSGSMQAVDDRENPVTRLASAKKEAISFIQKRLNDPVGIVLFSQVAVSRCPLTLDKKMLEQILSNINFETLPADGTVLSQGMITAANRLKKSTAKTRIMIVLTDGVPTPNDVSPKLALDLAKKLGIKIYTVGIGSEDGGWVEHPIFGWYQAHGHYNETLLQEIASQTGGRFFRARNQKEMAVIYNAIDELERSAHDAPVYAKYFEYFIWFLWAALLALVLELVLVTTVWKRL